MDNPEENSPKRPKKTINERRKEAKKARAITRERMEAEEHQRKLDEENAKELEQVQTEKEMQLKRKEAQEQRDYEMAMAMSSDSTSTPTENPLLLPLEYDEQKKSKAKGAKQKRDAVKETTNNKLLLPADAHNTDREPAQSEEKQSLHKLDCSGCGGVFVGTRNLKTHVTESPKCLEIWGGDMKSLSKIVTAEFKRRRSSQNYSKNRDAVLAKRLDDYWVDPIKERARKRTHYEANKEKERERQAAVRANNADRQTTLKDFETFKKEGRYGPIFPCVSCWQLNWYFVTNIVEDLDTLPNDFVDVQHIRENISLFQKQNRFFVCNPCKSDLDLNKCPKMSTKNHLQTPWKDVPSHLLTINTVGL